MKLGLGAVQFGMDYGIANREGRTTPKEAARILAVAAQSGVRILDTAALYGNSEEVLGRFLPRCHPFSIVTKTPGFGSDCPGKDNARLLEDTFHRSLAKLGQPSTYGLLIHHADDLLAPDSDLIMERMLSLKRRGLVEKIGVSVYTGRQIDQMLDNYPLDLIQLPINALDQRLLSGGHLARLKKAGVEIHARSVFLQGLLLMDPDTLPSFFDPVRECLKNYHRTIRRWEMTPVEAALGFVAGLEEIDVVICGVNNHRQLQELTAQTQKPVDRKKFSRFAVTDEDILNPSLWRL